MSGPVLVSWSPCRSRCPACGERGGVEVRQVMEAKPHGSYSLAGCQDKVTATVRWIFRCDCGASGPAEPK